MSILSLKRWERVEYEASPGVFISMKLKRLKRNEAKPLAKILVRVFEEFEKARSETLTSAQKAAIMAQAYEVIPEEQLKGLFAAFVSDVEGFEIDEERITTGPGLLDEADDDLLFWLLMRLHKLSKLTVMEGKDSSSPAGSLRLVRGSDGSFSHAQSIESEGGAKPSGVSESTPKVADPSIARG
jgi:hypothetical protein